MAKKKKKQPVKSHSPKQQNAAMVQEAFRYFTKHVNQKQYENPSLRVGMDYDPIRVKRRMAAVMSTLEEVRERVLTQYPELREHFSVENDWAQINAQPQPAYDFEENISTVTMGAAIWMLDRLKECGKLQQATCLLPLDPEQSDDVYAPDVWDPCHSEEMRLGMMAVIQERNRDCVGKYREPGVLQNEAQLDRFFMDLHTAENTHRQNVPSRVRFEKILNLIPTGAKEAAAAAFTDRFWDWVDRYYRCRRIYALQELQLDKEYNEFYDRAEKEATALSQRRKVELTSIPLQPMAVLPKSHSYSGLPSGVDAEIMKFSRQAEAYEKKLDERKAEIEDRISDLCFYLRWKANHSYEHSVKTFGKEIADIWADFTIEDPYALCFGFLYLLDSGSELPWLYFPGVNLFSWNAYCLPWSENEYDVEEDPYWDLEFVPSGSRFSRKPRVRLPKRIKVPDMENWYQLAYGNQKEEPEHREMRNLAQIVYEITGGIMPRDLARYLPALEELDTYGISGKKAVHPLLYCMTLLGEGRRQSSDWRMLLVQPEDEDGADALSPEALQEKLKQLQQEVEQLRHALHEAGRESREAKKRQEAADKTHAMERQELADLRELVFHQQEGTYADDTPSTEIQFPCHTTKRIVVFGGHDSWAREIKPKLPDVRFVDRTVIPNAQLIRNADVVWIQTNALSHAYYYKIIDEVRKYDIPLRYFSYASAAKCAEQLARQDME